MALLTPARRPPRARSRWRLAGGLATAVVVALAAAGPAGATEGEPSSLPPTSSSAPAPVTSEPAPPVAEPVPEVEDPLPAPSPPEAAPVDRSGGGDGVPEEDETTPPGPPAEAPAATDRATGTATGTGPNGQTLTVTPTEGLDPAGTDVTVTGAGFTDGAGFAVATEGMYVALCVDRGPGAAPSPCVGGVDMEGGSGSSKWVTNNPYDGVPPDAVAPVGADGSFQVTLRLSAADEFVDCLALPAGERCVVATRMDHRASADRSQDVKVPVCWTGQPACATDPIPPPPPDPGGPGEPGPPTPPGPGDEAPFGGYAIDDGPTTGPAATGGLPATGPELAPLPWGLALLAGGLALVVGTRRSRSADRSRPRTGGTTS